MSSAREKRNTQNEEKETRAQKKIDNNNKQPKPARRQTHKMEYHQFSVQREERFQCLALILIQFDVLLKKERLQKAHKRHILFSAREY